MAVAVAAAACYAMDFNSIYLTDMHRPFDMFGGAGTNPEQMLPSSPLPVAPSVHSWQGASPGAGRIRTLEEWRAANIQLSDYWLYPIALGSPRALAVVHIFMQSNYWRPEEEGRPDNKWSVARSVVQLHSAGASYVNGTQHLGALKHGPTELALDQVRAHSSRTDTPTVL